MNLIKNKQFDEERALYNLKNTQISDCNFSGPADGESVLKEARDISLINCDFSLRYPLWHVNKFTLENTKMDMLTRAAIWYSEDGEINKSFLNGIKAVRECQNILIKDSKISSPEFAWKCNGLTVIDSEIESEYLFFDSENVKLDRVKMKGKYSFQYVSNLEINNSFLDTKDAFWHSENITVKNSTVKGEYLGWYSKGLTLINCKISGTQPLCYCENLTLINCSMENCDLAFEYSEVNAEILGYIDSVKNPKSGIITANSVGEIINDNPVMKCNGKVIIKD